MRNASQTERARHLLHTRMRASVVGLLLLAILPCCFHDPCPRECQEGHRTVRSTTAMVAVCSKCDCVFRGRLVPTLRLLCRTAVAVSSTSTLAIDVRLSDTAVSPLLHRCCCIVSLCLQQTTLFRAVRLLFAAHKFL